MKCTSSQEENPEGELPGPGLDQMGNITVKQRHPSSPMASPPIFDDQSGHPQIKSRTSPYFHPGEFCLFVFFFLFCSTQVMGTPPAQQEIPSSPISSIPSSLDSAAIRWLLTHYQGFFDSFLSNCCFCFQLVAFCKTEACRGCVRCVIPD